MVWLASCMPFTDARVLAVEASIAPRVSEPMESVSGKKLEKASLLNALNGNVKGEAAAVMIFIHLGYLAEYTRQLSDCNNKLCTAQK